MPKCENRKLKILYVLKLLWESSDENHPMTVPEIIAGLERMGLSAERKSVYDDISALEDFGIDVEKSSDGRGWFIASRTFELPELRLLLDAVQSARFITRKKSEALIKKIESFVSRSEAEKLSRSVYTVNRVKTANEAIYYAVDKVHEAISAGVMLRFVYMDWTPEKTKRPRRGGKPYTVSPWSMSWDDENYYMIAYDGALGKIKHYRIDKMESCELTDEPRLGGELFREFDAALYSRRIFGMFGGEPAEVTLDCRAEFAGVIIDRFGTDVMMIPGGRGFTVTVGVEVSPQFYAWVFALGDGVRIASPKHVADGFAAEIRAAAELYKEEKA